MKTQKTVKNLVRIPAKKVKIHAALWIAVCPYCGQEGGSASEPGILPDFVLCDCQPE